MGLQFRKSIKLLPGIRLNIGTRGLSSLSIRMKFIRINISKRGIQGNINLPGTGFSYRFNRRKKSRKRKSRRRK